MHSYKLTDVKGLTVLKTKYFFLGKLLFIIYYFLGVIIDVLVNVVG